MVLAIVTAETKGAIAPVTYRSDRALHYILVHRALKLIALKLSFLAESCS